MVKSKQSTPTLRLPAFDQASDTLNVVIETPKGCRNKYKYDEQLGVFKLNGVLPTGAVFPYDFGYVPGTLGEDGDPLDVLLLMDEPAFVGCLVPSRLVGVIEAEQTERDGKTMRNDRLVAVAQDAHNYRDLKSLKDINENLLREICHFFVSYNEIRGKQFKELGRHGPGRAHKLLAVGVSAGASAEAEGGDFITTESKAGRQQTNGEHK